MSYIPTLLVPFSSGLDSTTILTDAAKQDLHYIGPVLQFFGGPMEGKLPELIARRAIINTLIDEQVLKPLCQAYEYYLTDYPYEFIRGNLTITQQSTLTLNLQRLLAWLTRDTDNRYQTIPAVAVGWHADDVRDFDMRPGSLLTEQYDDLVTAIYAPSNALITRQCLKGGAYRPVWNRSKREMYDSLPEGVQKWICFGGGALVSTGDHTVTIEPQDLTGKVKEMELLGIPQTGGYEFDLHDLTFGDYHYNATNFAPSNRLNEVFLKYFGITPLNVPSKNNEIVKRFTKQYVTAINDLGFQATNQKLSTYRREGTLVESLEEIVMEVVNDETYSGKLGIAKAQLLQLPRPSRVWYKYFDDNVFDTTLKILSAFHAGKTDITLKDYYSPLELAVININVPWSIRNSLEAFIGSVVNDVSDEDLLSAIGVAVKEEAAPEILNLRNRVKGYNRNSILNVLSTYQGVNNVSN